MVLVKKIDGKWRMYVNYANINVECPKNPYPLPSIDQLIDTTTGHVMLNFMDVLSGYNQNEDKP